MIKIHLSFWAVAAFFWIMGLGWDFLMVAAAVTTHELAHILVAKIFGCKLQQLKISALGEMALIHHLDRLSPWQRTAIITAGPACNLILGLLAGYMHWGLFGFYNLVLCGFNLLPIFPLDGARLFQLWAGNWIGAMRANRWTLRTGLVCCWLLMLLGIVQIILYFPNFTMLLAGFALWRRNRSLLLELTGEFYMAMLKKPARLAKNALSVRALCAYSHQPLSPIVDSMGWDHILTVTVPDLDNAVINELEIINHVARYGLNDTLSAIMMRVQK